jgi:hypothetical protein
VGAVGSGKTTAAVIEVGYFLPRHIALTYNITKTRWCVVRKTVERLMDTDQYEFTQWYPDHEWHAQKKIMVLHHPRTEKCPALEVEVYFRSCDNPQDVDKFRSLNFTGMWLDESIEITEQSSRGLLMTRIGRYPNRWTGFDGTTHSGSPVRYWIETSNPCSIDFPMYWQYSWRGTKVDVSTGELEMRLPPGPVPQRKPIKGYIGWWQVVGENEANLRPGYYDDLRQTFPESPEMLQMLVEGKPGYKPAGKGVYRNFNRDVHMSSVPLIWFQEIDPYTGRERGTKLFAGWDNTGTSPACIVGQVVGPFRLQILREFYDDRMGIVDFTNHVMSSLEIQFPGFQAVHYCDPAAFAKFSDGKGGITSNGDLQQTVCGIKLVRSEQSLDVRLNAVDQMLARRDGILVDPSCIRLINGFFGGYVYEENIRMGLNEFKVLPKKDKFSHVHDALQYLVVKLFSPMMKSEVEQTVEEDKEIVMAMQSGTSEGWHDSRRMLDVRQENRRGDRANTGGDPRRAI